MQKDRENILKFLQESEDFAQHVTQKTKEYLFSLNEPTLGTLKNFSFNLDKNVYTVDHSFEYEGKEKCNFHIISLERLWHV